MNKPKQPLPQISLPRKDHVSETPFGDDKLGRKALADRLTSYVERLREGSVMAIDAPWGEGKSYFGRNWARQLENAGYKVAYIDAFEQDYIEDPFLLVAAEIADLLGEDPSASEDLRRHAVGVMKVIVPFGAKALLNVVGRLALGSVDLSTDVAEALQSTGDSVSDAAEGWLRERLDSHADEKAALVNFKAKLSEYSSSQENPVVVFVDELDRCRPDYAVHLVERIKHLFDVRNLVFVLLINRRQLEQSIKGVYGADTDAEAYLGKFVNVSFRLPKRVSYDSYAAGTSKDYVDHVFKKYQFSGGAEVGNFLGSLKMMSSLFRMSLRDIDKAMVLYACAQPVTAAPHFLAYLIALKVSRPSLFDGVVGGDESSHVTAKDLLHSEIRRLEPGPGGAPAGLLVLYEWHEAHLKNYQPGSIGVRLENVNKSLWNYSISIEHLLSYLAGRIELQLEG